ncbi:MAG: HEAT repeat domain-containing protein, partial [Myxococcaceae bacterium]
APATPAVPVRASLAVPRLTAAGLAFLGWAVVASAFLLRLAVLRARLLTTLGERAPVVDPMVRARLEGLCQDVGHARPVRLTTAEGLRSPVALGWSEICLPAEALLELDDAQQRSVLAHELAHLRRLDPVWLVMGTVLEHLFFFQPLNRLARARMQEVAEFLCDDWAAARNGSGLDVARGLASVAAWLDGHPPSVPLAGMAEHPSQLLARVTRLLERGADEVERLRPWHVGGMALLLLMTVLVAPGVRAAPERLAAGPGQTRTPAPRSDAGAPQQQVRTMVAVQSLDRELLDGDGTGGGSGSPPPDARSEPTPERAPGKTSSPATTRSAPSKPQVRTPEAQPRGQGLLVGPGAPPLLLAFATPGVPPVPPVAAVAPAPPVPPAAPRPPSAPSAAEIERIRRDAQRMARDAQRQARDAMRHHGRNGKGHHERTPADPKTVDALISALKDADPGVRQAAAESLGRIGDARAVEPLSGLLGDGNVDVRRSAVEALGQLDDAKAIPALSKATGDANPAVRREAAEALLSFDEPAATEALIKLLGDADPRVRVIAMEGLSHRGDRRALAPLAKLVKDPNVEVRARAVRALSRFRDPAAQDALVTALKDENADVRTAAAAGLGEMELKSAPPALLEATRDPSSEVRQQAAEALGQIHDGKAVPQLKALLDDSDADVRAAAVEALSEIRDGASLQALIAAMQSKDVTVRRAAAQALGQRD